MCRNCLSFVLTAPEISLHFSDFPTQYQPLIQNFSYKCSAHVKISISTDSVTFLLSFPCILLTTAYNKVSMLGPSSFSNDNSFLLKKTEIERRQNFILSNGKKRRIPKLPVFTQSSIMALYSSCDESYILRVDKIVKCFGTRPTVS